MGSDVGVGGRSVEAAIRSQQKVEPHQDSLIKKFQRIGLRTPPTPITTLSRLPPPHHARGTDRGLSPIMEDLAELALTSSKKRSKDDFGLVSDAQNKLPSLDQHALDDAVVPTNLSALFSRGLAQ